MKRTEGCQTPCCTAKLTVTDPLVQSVYTAGHTGRVSAKCCHGRTAEKRENIMNHFGRWHMEVCSLLSLYNSAPNSLYYNLFVVESTT